MNSFLGTGVTYPSFGFYALLILWGLGWVLGSICAGSWVLARVGLRFERRFSGGVVGLGVGLALLSTAVFFLAAAQLLHGTVLWTLACGWCVLGWGWAWTQRQTFRSWLAGPQTRWEWALALVGFGAVVLNVLPAGTPAVDWDGLAYHLALPKIYLQHGGFVFRPDIFHNLLPQFTEMLFMTGLWLPYGIGAKLIHWGLGLLAASALWSLGRERGWRIGAGLAALVFYLQFLVHIESGTAFIDLAGAAYVALAMLAFYYSRTQPAQPRWLYLGAFFLGVTAATKWHGLAILELGLCMATVLYVRFLDKGTRVRVLGGMLLWGHLPVLPYLVRAWVQGGNPVWPLAYPWFGGAGWSADMAQRFSTLMQQYATMHTGLLGWLRLPLDLLMHGEKFGLGGADLRGPIAGSVLLGLLSLWHYLRRNRSQRAASESRAVEGWTWVLAGIAFAAFWFFSSPQARFLLPLYPVCAWLAVEALYRLWSEHKTLGVRSVLVIAGLLLVAGHPPIHRSTLEQVKVLTGRLAPSVYITQEQAHYPACQWLNQHVQTGEKVLLFGENRGFYLDASYIWGDPAMQCVVDFSALHTPEALAARLQVLGVKWLLLRRDVYGPEYLRPEYKAVMEEMATRYGHEAWFNAKVRVVYLDRLEP